MLSYLNPKPNPSGKEHPKCPHFNSRMGILLLCGASTTHTDTHTRTQRAEETEGMVHVWKAMG